MAEVDVQKPLSLAQQYALPQKEEKSDPVEVPVDVVESETPTSAAVEEASEKPDETPVVVEKTDETPVVAETTDETPVPAEKTGEESSESPEHEETPAQEVEEQQPELKLQTAPADIRFPTTNQTRHCFTRYIEYHRCVAAKGEDEPECNKFARYYRSLCPGEWVERWNEQRENGTFPGPL